MAKDDESALEQMKVDDLREKAREAGVSGASSMRKSELVEAVSESGSEGESTGTQGDGGLRTGPNLSKSLQYAQEITSTDEEPEREGRSLVTTDHEVIRQWAEARGGRPATVEGTEHGDRLGVLRFDFGDKTDNLREVSWEEWFRTFDERGLNFVYQETRSDGRQSNFFRLENPNREDA